MRINKFIASAGICARRAADDLIRQGRVKVNHVRVTEPGMDVQENDIVMVDDSPIKPAERKYYIMLNKPDGYVTTVHDQFDRASVTELVTDIEARLFPVGRLDYHTEGLLLMTNDGDFANKLTHPSQKVYKTYIARVKGFPKPADITRLCRGIYLEDGKTAPCKAEVIRQYPEGVEMSISIYEGRNRQVRRMIEAIGGKVISLRRISIGNVRLGHLPLGKWRHLTQAEINEFVKEK
ncbi:MAG: pseudouridine synthase [Clostridia bacterium]|nr:pseudouridine synthase [Clostridia bacterium]